ncbi:hypothetical protein AMTRI_Chr04g179850 [Amborella trichopoda]
MKKGPCNCGSLSGVWLQGKAKQVKQWPPSL